MEITEIVKALIPTIIEKVFGRQDEMIVDKNGLNDKIVSATKGLIRSKTAWFAASSGAILAAIQMLPLEADMKAWMTFGALVAQLVGALYYRAVTMEEV